MIVSRHIDLHDASILLEQGQGTNICFSVTLTRIAVESQSRGFAVKSFRPVVANALKHVFYP